MYKKCLQRETLALSIFFLTLFTVGRSGDIRKDLPNY